MKTQSLGKTPGMRIKTFFEIRIDPARNFGLDVLRCFAIVTVMIGHSTYLVSKEVADIINYFVLDGVSIFFVLSGFLIGGILLRSFEENTFSYKLLLNFWRRRWFRTIPSYFLILILLCMAEEFRNENFSTLQSYRYFIFSQNVYSPHPLFFGEAWSLSIEEWFYVLMPIAIISVSVALKLAAKKSILLTIFLFIIGGIIYRYYRFLNTAVSDMVAWDFIFRKQVVTRLDSLMYGVLGAYLVRYHKPVWEKHRRLFFVAGIGLLISRNFITAPDYSSLYWCVFHFSVNASGTLLLIPYLINIKAGVGIIYRSITIISLISYSMYLINLSVVQQFLINPIHVDGMGIFTLMLLKVFLFWFFTIMLALVMYKYFEIPTTQLRDSRKYKKLMITKMG